MEIKDELRTQVQKLEETLRLDEGKFRVGKDQRDILQNQYYDLLSKMNIREKYFRGWFGGSKTIVKSAAELKKSIEAQEKKVVEAEEKVSSIKKNIEDAITSYLATHDLAYGKLWQFHKAIRRVKGVTDTYMKKINTALSEVDDAQDMETLDMYSDNDGIEFISSMENDEAEDAIRDVKRYTATFQNALQEYSKFVKGEQIAGLREDLRGVHIGDDLMFDLMFDTGFDFMSWSILDELEEAEDKLRDLKSEVSAHKHKIDTMYRDSETKISAYIKLTREACK